MAATRRRKTTWRLLSSGGREYELREEDRTVIGRFCSDVMIPSRTVERRHAELSFDPDLNTFAVTDFNSQNGTFLNDHKVASEVPHAVQDDDILRFGHDPLQFRLVRMNSEDSLNQDAKERSSPLADINQQGAEMVESPRGSTGTSSPASMRREMSGAPMQQQMMAPVVFDPATGQQFYMPPQPQLLYQPVYLPAAPTGGIFYQPIGAAHPSGAYFMPPQYMPQQQPIHAASPQRFVSTPPTSVASQQPQSTSSSCTHCHPATTTTNANFDSDTSSVRSDSVVAPPHHHHRHDHHDLDQHSNPDSTSTMSTPEHIRTSNRYHQGATLEKEHGRTPLFGQQPAWWGEDEQRSKAIPSEQLPSSDNTPTHNDSKSAAAAASSAKSFQSFPDADRSAMSDTEAIRMRPSLSPPAGFAGRRSLKPVRMDFDFSSESSTKSTPVSKPAPATAFTVTFDSENDAVSLQDAARKSNSGRRMMRRSAPVAPRQEMPTIAPSTDPKEYLLNKMLHGESAGRLLPQDNNVMEQKRDSDALSDAGTYVIDNDETKFYDEKRMMMSQVLDEESSSRTPSPSPTDEDEEEATPREEEKEKPPPTAVTGDRTDRRGLLKELLKMSSPVNHAGSPAVAPTPSSPANAPAAVRSRKDEFTRNYAKSNASTHRHSMATQPIAKPHPVPPSTANSTASSANSFRRGDGGRFSMRAGPTLPPSRPSAAGGPKPPFRAGVSGRNSSTKDSDEMVAWLRRKDYNPMKAAAAAKKSKAPMTNGKNEHFLANRSISFHIGEGPGPGLPAKPANQKPASVNNLAKNRSHEEGDLPAWNHVEEDLIVNYSRGMINDLKQMTISADDSLDTEYTAAVAQATDKLAKQSEQTIQLIRATGTLSSSMERLLNIAENENADESLREKLDRLSTTFDVVNRFLAKNQEKNKTAGYRSKLVTSRSPSATRNNARL